MNAWLELTFFMLLKNCIELQLAINMNFKVGYACTNGRCARAGAGGGGHAICND